MTEPLLSRHPERSSPLTHSGRDVPEDLDYLRDPRAQRWFADHSDVLHQEAYGQRILYLSLATGFVLGLLAHVIGYLLRTSVVASEPLGLMVDLLYALGFALWTGVVMVVFVDVWPQVKRRQIRRALQAYEALQRNGNQSAK